MTVDLLANLYAGNSEVDYNTVRVQWSSDRSFVGGSTVGFFGFAQGGPPEAGIHLIKFGEAWNYPAMIHELGHTLGMAH